MKKPKTEFEKAAISDWKDYVDKRVTFFATNMGGRVVKLRVHFKPEEKGYITWYLAVRRCPAEEAGNKKWTTPWLKLEDWKQLGILSLVLSEFCIKTRYMSKENFKKVQLLKRKWDKFVKHDFKKLNSIKRLIHEFQESY